MTGPPSNTCCLWPGEFRAAGWTGLGESVLKSWTALLAADTGMKARVIATPDTVTRFRAVRTGECHITGMGAGEGARMLEAAERYAGRETGPFQVRVVWAQSRSNSGFFVRGDSPVRTIKDVKPGIRIADMRGYVENQPVLDGFLAWAGVKQEDVVWVPAKDAEHKAQLVVDGMADLAFAIPSAQSIYRAEAAPHGIHWIDLNAEADPEGAERFWESKPLINFGKMFNGVPSCLGHWGTCGTSLYVTREETDAGFVNNLVRWLDANYARFKGLHPWNQYMNLDILMEELKHSFLPCHDGLVRYLKEKGIWTPTHEVRRQLNLALVSRYCESNRDAIEQAGRKGIAADGRNREWVSFWEKFKRERGLPPFRTFASLSDSRRRNEQ